MARGTIITKTLKDKSKRYVAVIRLNGKQVWKTYKRRIDAETYLDRNAQDDRDGTYRELKKGTFEQYIEIWRKKYLIPQELKPSTLSGYAYVLDKHLVPAFGSRQIAAIATADITDFRAAMLKDGQSIKSVKNLLNLLSRIFADAIEDSYLRLSPMPTRRRKADKKTKAEGKGRALQPGEAQRLLEQCEDTIDADDKKVKANPELRLIILLGLLAGLRRGEIFALQWNDIAWDGDLIHVRRNLFYRHGKHHKGFLKDDESKFVMYAPKSEKSIRDVDLSPALKKELRARWMQSADKHGLIFQSSNQTPLDPHNVYERWFKPAVERAHKKAEKEKDQTASANLKGLRLHDCRHTFGSWKIAQGEDVLYVSAQMGHAKPSITADVYSHLLEKRRPHAATKTDEILFGRESAKAQSH